MLKQIVFFLVLAVLNNVESVSIKFKPCHGDSHVAPTKVEFTQCTEQPCKFYHKQTVDVKITFVASSDETSLKAAIYGILIGLPIGFPMPNPDGCKDQGIGCPIVKGKEYTYHGSFYVKDYYPKIKLTVQWQLDGADTNQFCFLFPMSIVDGTPIDDTLG